MNKWNQFKLGDLIHIKHGFAFSGEYITSIPSKHILLTPGNFKIGGGFKGDKYKYFTGEIPESFILHSGDLVVTMTDLSKDTDTLGYSAFIPSLRNHLFLHNQRIGLIEKYNNQIDTKFLYWLLRTFDYREYILGTATGTSVQHTSPSRILGYTFDCPSLPEQRAIASVLSSLDDKIDLLHRQNATLEAMAEALFRQWFVVEAKEEWETIKLKDIFNIFIGRTPPRKEQSCFSFLQGNKWVSIKDMGEAGIFISDSSEYLTDEAVNKYNIPQIPANTVILSFKMTVGRVKITTAPMYSNEAIACFVPRNNYLSKNVLYFFLKAYEYDSLGSTSSIVTAINSNIIKDIEMKLPPKNLIDRFTVFSDQLLNKIYYNQSQIRTLEKIRDSLLPKLMSGEMRVKF